jgi:hypothetical protein
VDKRKRSVPSDCGLVPRLKLATVKKINILLNLTQGVDLNRSFQVAEHVTCIDISRNECRDVGEPEEKGELGRPRNKNENNIKSLLKK